MGELDFLSWIGNEDKAVRFFESRRWPNGRFCPECGSGLFVMYKISVSRKGISSLQLAKELDRPQKTNWHMLQRVKEACGNKEPFLSGMVEADEKQVGGSEFNKHESRKLRLGRGSVGKQAILRVHHRASVNSLKRYLNQVRYRLNEGSGG